MWKQWIALVPLIFLAGCQREEPKVRVNAPGVNVEVKDSKVDVRTPVGDVKVNR